MSRGTAALDGRRRGPATLLAGVLIVLLGVLACVALRPTPGAEPPSPGQVPVTWTAPAANAVIVTPTPLPEAPEVRRVAAAKRTDDLSPVRPAEMPYRFIGKSTAGAETTIVLFGRGRVVTVEGPRVLDDEYVIEAVFDDYLVIRHFPTGVGTFLALATRQRVAGPLRDPEDTPRD